MEERNTIALTTVQEKVLKGEEFSFDDLQDEIISKGGLLEVSSGVHVVKYLGMLEGRRILRFNKDKYKYEVIVKPKVKVK